MLMRSNRSGEPRPKADPQTVASGEGIENRGPMLRPSHPLSPPGRANHLENEEFWGIVFGLQSAGAVASRSFHRQQNCSCCLAPCGQIASSLRGPAWRFFEALVERRVTPLPSLDLVSE